MLTEFAMGPKYIALQLNVHRVIIIRLSYKNKIHYKGKNEIIRYHNYLRTSHLEKEFTKAVQWKAIFFGLFGKE